MHKAISVTEMNPKDHFHYPSQKIMGDFRHLLAGKRELLMLKGGREMSGRMMAELQLSFNAPY